MVAYLLRGLHGARRRRGPREIPEERCPAAFPARSIAPLSPRKRLRLTRLQVRDPEQTRMLPESIRVAPSDFEARRLLLQSALPGTRRLFVEVIGRMDERGHVIV